MFKQNKYKILYDKIIENAKNRITNGNSIYECHHILPRSLGGSEELENLVFLTLREHFLCHKLLPKFLLDDQHKHKMLYALHRMMFSGKYKLNSKQYEKFRIQFSESLKKNHPSKKDNSWLEKHSEAQYEAWKTAEERRKKTSERMKETWRTGKITPEQSRKNGKHNFFGKLNHNSLAIEYKGIIYYGWRELKEQTGISKDLYKSYYEKGLDPSPRIGKNGPPSKGFRPQKL